jgi:hypothetical protein
MMSTAQEHHAEAERLLALVRTAVGDDYRGAADHVPALLAALVHATLASSATAAVTKDRPASRDRHISERFHPKKVPEDPNLPQVLQVPDSIFQEDPGPE